jgi:hypothetical protein
VPFRLAERVRIVQLWEADRGVLVGVDGSQRNFEAFVGDEDLTTEGLCRLDA